MTTRYLQKVRLTLVREKIPGVEKELSRKLLEPSDVYSWFNFLQDSDREKLLAIYLNCRNEVVCFDIVSIGTPNYTVGHPREIMKPAILANAERIILVHNHPSGSIEPSEGDINMTRETKAACELMGFELLDHVIIGEGRFLSLKEYGLLE